MPPVISRDPEVEAAANAGSACDGDSSPSQPQGKTARRSPSSARRGPFRPEQLVPARARIEARALARAFRGVDALTAVAACAATYVLLSGQAKDLAAGAALTVGLGALLLALRALDAYVFARREPLPRHLLRVAAAFGAAATAALIVTLATTKAADRDLFPVWTFMGLAPLLTLLHLGWWSIISRGRTCWASSTTVWRAAPGNIEGVPVLGAPRRPARPQDDALCRPCGARHQIGRPKARVRLLARSWAFCPTPVSLFWCRTPMARQEMTSASGRTGRRAADRASRARSTPTASAFNKRVQDLIVQA
jgi:hypothetical protein